MPPKTSALITMGTRNVMGKIHIKRGDIISAPPNPLSRLIQPPKTAAKISKNT
jgi:hypothetical protein